MNRIAAERLPPLLLPDRKPPSLHGSSGRSTRFRMETENRKSRRYGGKGPHHWYALLFLMRTLKVLLKAHAPVRDGRTQRPGTSPLQRDRRSGSPRLPRDRRLRAVWHLSDLATWTACRGLEQAILRPTAVSVQPDSALTAPELHGPIGPHAWPARRPAETTRACAAGTVDARCPRSTRRPGRGRSRPGRCQGIRMLGSREREAHRGERRSSQVVGTDDRPRLTSPTRRSTRSRHARSVFTMALVHFAEAYDIAADLGVDLYLCGHTSPGSGVPPGRTPGDQAPLAGLSRSEHPEDDGAEGCVVEDREHPGRHLLLVQVRIRSGSPRAGPRSRSIASRRGGDTEAG